MSAEFMASSADWILARQSCAVWRFRRWTPAARALLARSAWMVAVVRCIVKVANPSERKRNKLVVKYFKCI